MKTIVLVITMILIGIACSCMMSSLSDMSFGTVKERHDYIKSIIGNLDDEVVASGWISDLELHKIGSWLSICDKTPGAL